MTDSAKPKPDDLSMREVATFLVDLADRLTKIETQGVEGAAVNEMLRSYRCLLYTSPSPRDLSTSRMPSSA